MYNLTKKEIYTLARSSLIDTYNYQRKKVREMKRKANADIERAKQWNILALLASGEKGHFASGIKGHFQSDLKG